MISEYLSTAVVVVVPLLGYVWITYIKRGPIYESDKSLSGKTALITGGNSGVGKATAIELAKRDARVVIASRNLAKSELVRKEIVKQTGNSKIVAMRLDLSSRESVRSFANDFKQNEDRLDYLINNAAVMWVNGTTEEGVNRIFDTNHLGHFLLTNLLLDTMKSHAATHPARIINLSSDAYKLASLSEESMHLDAQGVRDIFKVYFTSKLAAIYFTLALHTKYKDSGITSYAVHPGAVKSELGLSLPWYMKVLVFIPGNLFARDPFYGCQTSMYCILDDNVVMHSGGFFNGCAQAELLPFAKDEQVAEKLWENSLKMTGLV